MANDNINKGTFDDLINEFNGVDKCCFIDTASVISGIAKFSVPVLKTKSIKIDPSLFIWFVGSLFLRILMNEKDTHGNKSFVCVIRECSIIPKDIMKQLGFHENICYICRILSGMREQICQTLGDDCMFRIIGADTKCHELVREVDDALCIFLSSQVNNSHILTCDGYNSFRKGSTTYTDLTIKKFRSGNKFKPLVSLVDVPITSRKCHKTHAEKFRSMICIMCKTTNFEMLRDIYIDRTVSV